MTFPFDQTLPIGYGGGLFLGNDNDCPENVHLPELKNITIRGAAEFYKPSQDLYHNGIEDPVNPPPENPRGFVEFIPYPTVEETDRYRNIASRNKAPPKGSRHFELFVGQIPNLLPLSYVLWAIDTLLEEYAVAWLLQIQKNGCGTIWVYQEAQRQRLLSGEYAMLFDVRGMWIARTKPGAKLLNDYAGRLKKGHAGLDPRVPKNSVVFERMRKEVVNNGTSGVILLQYPSVEERHRQEPPPQTFAPPMKSTPLNAASAPFVPGSLAGFTNTANPPPPPPAAKVEIANDEESKPATAVTVIDGAAPNGGGDAITTNGDVILASKPPASTEISPLD